MQAEFHCEDDGWHRVNGEQLKPEADIRADLALPLRVSPELEYLEVKWAGHLPDAIATTRLKQILPVDQAISTVVLRNCVWSVGRELDNQAESAIRGERANPPTNRE